MARNYSRYEVVVCPTCQASVNQPCRGGIYRAQQVIPHAARRRLVDSGAAKSGPISSKPSLMAPVRFAARDGGEEKITWVKLNVAGGGAVWINSSQVRRIQADRYGDCEVVFTTQDRITTVESLDQVMAALGYKAPPPPPLETYETAAAEDQSRSEFAESASISGEDK